MDGDVRKVGLWSTLALRHSMSTVDAFLGLTATLGAGHPLFTTAVSIEEKAVITFASNIGCLYRL